MIRRSIDFAFAVAALVLLSPLFLLICIANFICSPGNPFYGAWRVGQDGRRFRMWKFRTMVRNADRIGGAIAAKRDPRITSIGRFLRPTKLDELPQFINLLTGDITLIGPRPEDPKLAELYSSRQREILKLKPGITGPGQIYYALYQEDEIPAGVSAERYYLDHLLDRKIRIDMEYIGKRTFGSDCRLVFDTVRVMAKALTGGAHG